MTKRVLFLFLCFFLAGTSLLMAQSEPDETDDPFKNSPFFSKPIDELIGNEKRDQPEEPDEEEKDDEGYQHRAKTRYVTRINNEGLDFGGFFESGPYTSNELYAAYPILPMVHFNRVDGVFLGIREERMQWYSYNHFFDIVNLHPTGMIGYSFGQDEWQYEAGLERYFGHKKHLILGGGIYNATSTDDYWRMGLMETSLSAVFAGYDYLDYYKQEGWGLYALARTTNYFEGGVSFNQNTFSSLEQSTDYHMFGKNDFYRPNPAVDYFFGTPVDSIDVAGLTLSAAFNPKHIILLPRFTFSLSGVMEIADPEYGISDYSYTKYLTEFISYLNFEPGAVLKYRLRAGSITGEAPEMKEFHLGGPGSLRAQPYKSLPLNSDGGNKMLLSNAEIQFGSGGYWNDGWIDLDDFYLSFFLDSGWTSYYSGENENPLDGFSEFSVSKMEHSGGIGLGTNSIRAEVAWDLNQTSRAPILWIRFNPTF